MKIHLYTNFTLGAGYQYAELTPKGVSQTSMSSAIRTNFTNGGCRMLLKSVPSEKIAYMMVKDIIYVNENKRIDDQGRKVFINFAIETDNSELAKLGNIFKGLLAEYSNVSNYIGLLYSIPADNVFNYEVDYEKFIELLDYLGTLGEKLTDNYNGIDDVINPKIRTCIDDIRSGESVVVLKGNDENYYARLNAELLKSSAIQYSKYRFIKEDDIKQLVDKPLILEDYAHFCCLLCDKTTSQQSSSVENTDTNVDPSDKKEDDLETKEQNNHEEESGKNTEPETETELERDAELNSEEEQEQDVELHLEEEPVDLTDCQLYNDEVKMKKLKFWGCLAASFVGGVLIGIAIGKIISSN